MLTVITSVRCGPRSSASPVARSIAVRSAIVALVVGEGDRLAADREVAPLRPADVVLGQQDPASGRGGRGRRCRRSRRPRAPGTRRSGRARRRSRARAALTRRPSARGIGEQRFDAEPLDPVAVEQLVVDAEARLGRQVVGGVQAGEEAVALARARRAASASTCEDLRRGRRSAPPGRGRSRCRGPRRGGRCSISPRISSSPGASGTDQLPAPPRRPRPPRRSARCAARRAPTPRCRRRCSAGASPGRGCPWILRCSLVKP